MSINRIVALLAGPTSTVAGLIAGYLATHDLGIHYGKDQIAKALTFVLVTGLTAAVHYASAHKWLDGFSKWERQIIGDNIPVLQAVEAGPHPDGETYDAAKAAVPEVTPTP